MSNVKVPLLRFPGFEDDYLGKKIGDIVEVKRGGGLAKADINSNGKFECVLYGQLFNHYGAEIAQVKYRTNTSAGTLSEHGDILMPTSDVTPDGLATASVLMKKGVRIGGDINILRLIKNICPIYLSHLINYSKKSIIRLVTGAAVKHIYAKDIVCVTLELPDNKLEQVKVGRFFRSIDKKINLLKQKHSLLQQYKKGVLQQLFSQQIRFKDDSGKAFPDWQKFRLKDVLELQNNPIDMLDDEKYELITIKRRNGGIVSRGIFDGKDVLVKNQFILKKGQFVISKRQIVHGACGMVPATLEGAILSNEYNVFEANSQRLNIHYFNLFATTLEMKKTFFRNSDGVHIEKLLFKTKSWLKEKALFPSVQEQEKILEFVSTLNEKIDLDAKQIELTQTFKKGLLQQMFV